MNQADLCHLMVPQHEIVADVGAAFAKAEIRMMVERARRELDERFDRILAFHNRSIAQRRRFRRIRALLEKA